ncbi:MAG: ATP-binding protein [Candidatus Omnitrophica bacterium]|nr:ATP-binding protein [Candidatus Omnitrophota bacterium]
MVKRHFWLAKITGAWNQKSVLWLSGVRRAGKTCLSQSIPGTEYFDCELPRIRRMMEDPESFLDRLKGKKIVLDEIHRLENPSELLKIAADHYPKVHILATGSSTLGASAKFKDTLTGRKKELWLTPMISEDLKDFGRSEYEFRFLRGGLPPFFLAHQFPERDFQEWMDAYWSKDIQELFRVERRHSFQKFAELLMAQSGGIFEATRFAHPCEVSRMTIGNYLRVLEATFVVHVISPFSSHRPTEIIAAPKVYAFDTGFVCYHRGWHDLRNEDLGLLWEHFVLNELQAHSQTREIRYWRDKRQHEIDFIIPRRGRGPIAIECKWSASDFDPVNLKAFHTQYPKAKFFLVAADIKQSFRRRFNGMFVDMISLSQLIDSITGI